MEKEPRFDPRIEESRRRPASEEAVEGGGRGEGCVEAGGGRRSGTTRTAGAARRHNAGEVTHRPPLKPSSWIGTPAAALAARSRHPCGCGMEVACGAGG